MCTVFGEVGGGRNDSFIFPSAQNSLEGWGSMVLKARKQRIPTLNYAKDKFANVLDHRDDEELIQKARDTPRYPSIDKFRTE